MIATDSTPSGQIRAASHDAGRRVDILAAVAWVLGALAVFAWGCTTLVHVDHRDDQNASAVVLAAVIAATLTVSAVACGVGAANRQFARTLLDRDVAVLYRRLEKLQAPPAPPINGASLPSAAADEWRAYLAGRLDRDDPA